MSLIATLEGLTLSEAPERCGCQGGCRLCRHGLSDAEVGAWNAQPPRMRTAARLAGRLLHRAARTEEMFERTAFRGFHGLEVDMNAPMRPMTTHEKWTLVLGFAGLCVSLAGTFVLAGRLGRK